MLISITENHQLALRFLHLPEGKALIPLRQLSDETRTTVLCNSVKYCSNEGEATLVDAAVSLGHFVHELFRVAVVVRQTGLQHRLDHLSVVCFHSNGQCRATVVKRLVQLSAKLRDTTRVTRITLPKCQKLLSLDSTQ